jgi:peptidylprolyl isomerase
MKTQILGLLAALFMMAGTAHAATPTDPENTLYMQLKNGTVTIKLRPDLAPNHVARIKELTRSGFYDGIIFHRVIQGFMAQTGDPTGTGRGGSGQNLKAEFSSENFKRGTVGMARADNPDSADSQFFINFVDTPFLDGKYTIIGEVVDGMSFVDAIAKGEPPANPDKIISLKVAADVDGQQTAPASASDATAEAQPAE